MVHSTAFFIPTVLSLIIFLISIKLFYHRTDGLAHDGFFDSSAVRHGKTTMGSLFDSQSENASASITPSLFVKAS
jgi:hypothetical protein